MKTHEKFMKKCLDLAQLGLKKTKTNPLVGCVIVHKNIIVSEGWHKKSGEKHAESEAIEMANDIAAPNPNQFTTALGLGIRGGMDIG